jgi:hypothetical protein
VNHSLSINNRGPFRIDYGYYQSGQANGTVSFNFTFTTAPFVLCQISGVPWNNTTIYQVHVFSVSTTAFQFTKSYLSSGSSTVSGANSEQFYWIAIGL